MKWPHKSVAKLEQSRNQKIVDKVIEAGNVRSVFEKRLNQCSQSQNQVIENEDGEHRQSEKPDQPAGLLPGAFLTVKKVHGLSFVCSTRPVGGKQLCERVKRITSSQPSNNRSSRRKEAHYFRFTIYDLRGVHELQKDSQIVNHAS